MELAAGEKPLVVIVEEAEAVDTLTLQDFILVLSEVANCSRPIGCACTALQYKHSADTRPQAEQAKHSGLVFADKQIYEIHCSMAYMQWGMQ